MKKILLILIISPSVLLAFGPGDDGVSTGDNFNCLHHEYRIDASGNSVFVETQNFGSVNNPSQCYQMIDNEHSTYSAAKTLSHDCQVNSNIQGPYN